ncbi:hypothetical protein [Sphingomonas sp.]|uniref:hypothetical protein n=1 Tax=Sphingomonas sp. TaxID=28214 RepID=UPI00286B41C0|nr:hypothetical protein [Sphingomonas sp.]
MIPISFTLANLIMLGIGLLALAIGIALLVRRGGSAAAVQVRLLIGTMALALGLVLSISAFALKGVRH